MTLPWASKTVPRSHMRPDYRQQRKPHLKSLRAPPIPWEDFAFFNGGTPTTDYGECASGHLTTTATFQNYTAPDGTTRQMKLCYASFPFQRPSMCLESWRSRDLRHSLSTVILADDTKWTFDYDNYGEVTFCGTPNRAGQSLYLDHHRVSLL